MAREGFCRPKSIQKDQKIRLLLTAKRISNILYYILIIPVSLLNTKGKRDQGIMDESTLILHAKSWTTPKKIRHDRFRSPGPAMADLLYSHFPGPA
ncbi:hypothetical protein [Paenibacillus maysiensis]|uniref:hypothetical protein n=1 Tax=Paenibacillus maysiensis TaxID=1155954 RepID=UPI0004B03EEF|nr:hypothetical protein [Paenibacillus maysiensis]